MIRALARAFGLKARLLDVHLDPDHDRSVFTLAGGPGALAGAVIEGARETLDRVDLRACSGVHPRVGVLDVAPIVYLADSTRGAASAEALVLADLLGDQLGLPVFLYGALAGGRTRAELRRGGPEAVARRMRAGELRPDFGPPRLDPKTGAVLVAARPPLIAFNLELAPPATAEDAQAIARSIREGGPEGLPSVRALGLWLEQRGVAQVSTNIEDHRVTSPHDVVEAVARSAQIAALELVGLAPQEALATLPDEIPIRNRATIEDALRGSA
jgi:glutamate formiminotransferase